ncbi:putative monooxygenase [Phycisphaerales bacterium]|nr:putative monooxygenase [Phycisphaerales bacterium]
MRVISKNDVKRPFVAPLGEQIFEMIGRPLELGGTTKHSFVHVVIPAKKSSAAHYHKVSEETYYVLSGRARMAIDGKTFQLIPGQACLIMPMEIHQIFNDEEEDLHFLTISAPAWVPEDSHYVEE